MSTPPSSPRVTEVDQFTKCFEDAEESLSKAELTLANCLSIALDAPKSPRVTEAHRAQWHKEAVLELEKAERKHAMCMAVTNERRKDLEVAWKKQLESRADVSVAKWAQECTDKLEEAKDAEIGAQLDVDRRRALARQAKRKWEEFGCDENDEFKKKLSASCMEPTKFPRGYNYRDSEDDEGDEGDEGGLKYDPSSPCFTPEPASPGCTEPASAWQCVTEAWQCATGGH
jgi:hypothetical protein